MSGSVMVIRFVHIRPSQTVVVSSVVPVGSVKGSSLSPLSITGGGTVLVEMRSEEREKELLSGVVDSDETESGSSDFPGSPFSFSLEFPFSLIGVVAVEVEVVLSEPRRPSKGGAVLVGGIVEAVVFLAAPD